MEEDSTSGLAARANVGSLGRGRRGMRSEVVDEDIVDDNEDDIDRAETTHTA